MDNTLEQLAQYINQELQRGQLEQTVRDSLVKHGWTQKAIDGAFGIMQYYQSHPSLPQPMGSGIPDPQVKVNEPAVPARPTTVQSQPLPNAQSPIDTVTTPYSPPPKKQKSGAKGALLALLIVVVLGLVTAGVWLVLSAHKKDTPSTKPLVTQAKPSDKDAERKSDINTIMANLTDYYVAHQTYPTITQMNDTNFTKQNKIATTAYKDPNWSDKNATCTTNGKAILAENPAKDCYAYSVSTVDGKPCDGGAMPCTLVRVTVFTNDGKQYTVSLIQNALSTVTQ